MRPTEILKGEHKEIKTMLKVLEGVASRLGAGAKIDPRHLNDIVEFIKVFADACHHGKEQDLLFPALEEAGIPREGGPIGCMLAEHDTGRGYVKGMNEAALAYGPGDPEAGIRFADNARAYASLLDQHIDKENNILYAMADMHLSETKQEELLERFEKVEVERIWPGRHEAFHDLLHRLEEIYVSKM